ncbi:MAG: hypothetical protein ABIJ40_18990 [Bacteroidota bacterium]
MILKTEGVIFLTMAWGFVLSLAGYFYYKVFYAKKRKRKLL